MSSYKISQLAKSHGIFIRIISRSSYKISYSAKCPEIFIRLISHVLNYQIDLETFAIFIS